MRHRKFRHCLEWYSYLTGQSFHETYRRLGREFGFDESRKPDEAQLVRAAVLLKQERANFHKKLEAFVERRREKKLGGSRQPRKVEVEALYTPDWLETSVERKASG
jgi:hypothetical protein